MHNPFWCNKNLRRRRIKKVYLKDNSLNTNKRVRQIQGFSPFNNNYSISLNLKGQIKDCKIELI